MTFLFHPAISQFSASIKKQNSRRAIVDTFVLNFK